MDPNRNFRYAPTWYPSAITDEDLQNATAYDDSAETFSQTMENVQPLSWYHEPCTNSHAVESVVNGR